MEKGFFKSVGFLWEVFLNTIYPKEYKCLCCEEETEEELCNKCKKDIRLVKDVMKSGEFNIYSYAYYKSTVKNLILDYKYHKDYNSGEYIADLLIEEFSSLICKYDLITYVPLTNKKMKKRGFNQCEVLSKHIGKSINIKVEKLLYKIKDNKEQKTLDMKSRISNQEGLFKCYKEIKGKSILLIDDVVTTGATVVECMKVLKSSGAKEVNALTFAKSTL